MKSEFYVLIFDNTHGLIVRNITYQLFRLKVFLPCSCETRFIDHSSALPFCFSCKGRQKIERIANNSIWLSQMFEARLLYCAAVYKKKKKKNRSFIFYSIYFEPETLNSIDFLFYLLAKSIKKFSPRWKCISIDVTLSPLHVLLYILIFYFLFRRKLGPRRLMHARIQYFLYIVKRLIYIRLVIWSNEQSNEALNRFTESCLRGPRNTCSVNC